MPESYEFRRKLPWDPPMAPDLRVTHTVTPESIREDDVAAVEVRIANASEKYAAKNVKLMHSALPNNLSLIDARETGASYDIIEPGQERVHRFQVRALYEGSYPYSCTVNCVDVYRKDYTVKSKDSELRVLKRQPDISLKVYSDEAIFRQGEEARISVVAENTGDDAASNLQFDVIIPPTLRMRGERSGRLIVKTGERKIHSVRVVGSRPGIHEVRIINISCRDSRNRVYRYLDQSLSLTVEEDNPLLQLIKTVDNSSLRLNEKTLVAVDVENTGTGTARRVTVFDQLPADCELVEGGNIWEGDIKSGEKISLQYTVIGNCVGAYSTRASAKYSDALGEGKEAYSDPVTIQVLKTEACIRVDKPELSTLESVVGEEFEYIVKLYNSGEGEAHGVEINLQPPSGFFVVSEPRQPAKIPPGENASLTVVLKGEAPGRVCISGVSISYTNPDDSKHSAAVDPVFVRVTPLLPHIIVSRQLSSKEIYLREQVFVKTTINNKGAGKAIHASFKDPIAFNLDAIKGETSREGELQPGESWELEYIIEPKGLGVVDLQPVKVTYQDEYLQLYESFSYVDTITVKARSEVKFKKSTDKSILETADTYKVSITITNMTDFTLRNIRVIDNLPPGQVRIESSNEWRGDVLPNEAVSYEYTARAERAGVVDLKPAIMTWSELDGGYRRIVSNPVQLTISSREPKVLLEAKLAKASVTIHEPVVIELKISNIGLVSVAKISIPVERVLRPLNYFRGNYQERSIVDMLAPQQERVITLTAESFLLGEFTVPSFTARFFDPDENMYSITSNQCDLNVVDRPHDVAVDMRLADGVHHVEEPIALFFTVKNLSESKIRFIEVRGDYPKDFKLEGVPAWSEKDFSAHGELQFDWSIIIKTPGNYRFEGARVVYTTAKGETRTFNTKHLELLVQPPIMIEPIQPISLDRRAALEESIKQIREDIVDKRQKFLTGQITQEKYFTERTRLESLLNSLEGQYNDIKKNEAVK